MTIFRAISLLALAALFVTNDAQAQPQRFLRDIRPLLKTYCFECHGDKKQKGDLNLERINTETTASELGKMWDQVARRMREGDMPPPGAKQLKDSEKEPVLRWIDSLAKVKKDCTELATDETQKFYRGYVMSRRLNRTEYNNTMRDLLGIDLNPGELLPADAGGGEGFDTTGSALFTSPVLLEKYLDAAGKVVDRLLPDKVDPTDPLKAPLEAARKKLLLAQADLKGSDFDKAQRILNDFARRAYRRPLTASESDRLTGLFDKARKRGDSFEQALKLPLKSVLISPHFLFLAEPEPEKEGIYRLGHYQIAARLSYFVWASTPDDTLLDLAARGQLHDETVLKQQLKRLRGDPRARGLAESFGTQWLGLAPLGTTMKPDARLFPSFTPALADAMRLETLLCLDAVLREDRSLLELLDADWTYLNETLAEHYGIKGVKGTEMRRVKLTDRQRGGVLTQAAVLTVASYPHRTSPVLRGRFVLEELLGSHVPPPPPGAGELPEGKDVSGLSLRQRLDLHRKKPDCAGCHARMDPIGFGLENYDAIGRWRDKDDGKPVDNSGVLPSGDKFTGPAELKTVLVEKRRKEFITNLTRKLLGYALGRELSKFDQCVVDDAVKTLEQNGYKPSLLLEKIILSQPYTHRYCKK